MLLFSLSLLLSYLIFLINCHSIDLDSEQILLIFIRVFIDVVMFHSTISSASSKTTLASNRSFIPMKIKAKSNPCFHENNNALDFDEIPFNVKRSPKHLVQSSTDVKNLHLYSSSSREESHPKNRPIRIESALLVSGYSHPFNQSLRHPSVMNIKRNGAGDENLSTYPIDKQVQTTNLRTDHTHYLTLESIPISNRRTIQFTSKQLLLISFSVFVLVILLCLGVIGLFF